MTMLLLPSGDYVNLATVVSVTRQGSGAVTVMFNTGLGWEYTGKDAARIVEALDSLSVKIAYRKRS